MCFLRVTEEYDIVKKKQTGVLAMETADMNLASKIIPFLRYSKLKRKVAKLPQIDPEAAANSETASFEEAMAFYREHMQ